MVKPHFAWRPGRGAVSVTRCSWARRWALLFLALLMFPSGLSAAGATSQAIHIDPSQYPVTQDDAYTSLEEVAVYWDTYGHLPGNYLSKKDAQALGWDNRSGNLRQVSPGASIGGDHFGNYENNPTLPAGKSWTECDINYEGGYRGGQRMVFSTDGLIYYSDDHYTTFRQVIIQQDSSEKENAKNEPKINKEDEYTSKEEVAAYLHKYGHLPKNYLTKSEAKKLGWSSQKDNLGQVAPGCAIGGNAFGNREGLLPNSEGRSWKECDINTRDGKRSTERLVYSSDGLIYYTADNHKTFQQLY